MIYWGHRGGEPEMRRLGKNPAPVFLLQQFKKRGRGAESGARMKQSPPAAAMVAVKTCPLRGF